MRVSKYIIQTNDAYIFCNEDVRTCVMPVILMNSKERKVYLKQKNIKSFNISNDLIDLSFVYSITNFFITCYMSVAT